jgi:hypothetical protein
MNEGGTAMKYSVMEKVSEKVSRVSQLDLKKILLYRLNLTSGSVFRLRWVVSAVLLSISTLVLLSGCADPVFYQPIAQAGLTQPTMTASTAGQKIRESLQHSDFDGQFQCQDINVTLTQFSFTSSYPEWNGPRIKYSYSFNELHDLVVNSSLAGNVYWVSLPRSCSTYWVRKNGEYARQFVDAVNAMKYLSGPAIAADFADFQEQARAWRALPVKPALPEDVQRCRIMAEDAFKNKDFAKAIEYYEQGLEIEPLWPQGHYMAGLMYGETGQDYGIAALHMKRYLELVPDGEFAKVARDKMYLWEGKAKEAEARNSSPLDSTQKTTGAHKKRKASQEE